MARSGVVSLRKKLEKEKKRKKKEERKEKRPERRKSHLVLVAEGAAAIEEAVWMSPVLDDDGNVGPERVKLCVRDLDAGG